MELNKINIYQRLRDFEVPAPILDEIFSNDEDTTILLKSWSELESAGMSGDEIASEIATMIFTEIKDDLNQNSVNEK